MALTMGSGSPHTWAEGESETVMSGELYMMARRPSSPLSPCGSFSPWPAGSVQVWFYSRRTGSFHNGDISIQVHGKDQAKGTFSEGRVNQSGGHWTCPLAPQGPVCTCLTSCNIQDEIVLAQHRQCGRGAFPGKTMENEGETESQVLHLSKE